MYRTTYKKGTELLVSDSVVSATKAILVVISIQGHMIRFRYINKSNFAIQDSFGFTEHSFYDVLDYSVLKEKQLWLWEQEEMEAELKRHEESI